MIKFKALANLAGLLAIAAFAMMGCEGEQGPAGPAADAGDLSCAGCHNETNLITAKQTAWSESLHGSGTAAAYAGGRDNCAGCHSGSSFIAMIAAGQNPGVDPAPPASEVTRQDCRTCHEIHTTYTDADWALRTTSAVELYAIEGKTFDGGDGNLCVNCHQPRRDFPVPDENGMITGISSHWGPHHGPQSAMLLGDGGAGVTGSAGPHYRVDDTCVTCHLGEGDNHTFEPDVDACQPCHSGATNFDIGDTQTEVQAMLDELGDKLVAAGLIDENTADGHPIVTEAPTAQATALFNWIYVAHEDKSLGVHNPTYTKALLQAGLDAL